MQVEGHPARSVDGTVGAGNAPANMIVGGAVYNTTAPAPSNGQSMADPNRNLRAAPQCNNVINIERTATTEVHTTGYGYVCSIVLIGATARSLASTKEPDNLRDRRHGGDQAPSTAVATGP